MVVRIDMIHQLVIVPLQIGVVFNILRLGTGLLFVIVPLQIGVVFNTEDARFGTCQVIVPL